MENFTGANWWDEISIRRYRWTTYLQLYLNYYTVGKIFLYIKSISGKRKDYFIRLNYEITILKQKLAKLMSYN